MTFTPIPDATEDIARQIVDAAFKVHKELGPGLLEHVYETCLCHELHKRGLSFRRQVTVPVVYDGIRFDEGFRLDILVEDAVICEIKSTSSMNEIHKAQLITYLKLMNLHLGLLINFNVPLIKKGIQRIIT